ncbi:fimbrial protein [Escherichia coli]
MIISKTPELRPLSNEKVLTMIVSPWPMSVFPGVLQLLKAVNLPLAPYWIFRWESQAHDFKGRAGQPPQNVQKVQKELSFDCNNISDGVKIYLSIDATPNTAYPSAIDLGNADVGAVIEDGKGNIC